MAGLNLRTSSSFMPRRSTRLRQTGGLTISLMGRRPVAGSPSCPSSKAAKRAGAPSLRRSSAATASCTSPRSTTVRLSYAHRFVADQNSLLFTAAFGELVQVSGFTTSGVRVFDLTDEQNPVELKPLVEAEGKTYRATVAPQEGGERVLLALSDKGYGQGAQVVAQQPSAWHDANQGADVVMITHGSLRPALEPLVGLRKQQGYQAAVVDVEDLYDEYSYGQKTPQATQEVIAGTRNWKVQPRWVLLVGDASSDGKNYLGLGENDLVPTRLVWTNTFETATDDWLGDVNGDGLAEVALGRLPVRTLLQAQMVINKIVRYDSNQTSGALLVA